jgi:hypothetical protein
MKKHNNAMIEPVPAYMKLISLRDLLPKLFSLGEFLQSVKLYYSDLLKEKQ